MNITRTRTSQVNLNFAEQTTFTVGKQPNDVITGDFNNDGNIDLAVANGNDDNVSILLGNGVGVFGLPTNFSVGDYPNSLGIGDFNTDQNLDLVIVNSSGKSVSVLLNDGNGNFSSQSLFDVEKNPVSVNVGDFNSDGNLDLVTANAWGSNNVSVLLGDGMGKFSPQTTFTTTSAIYYLEKVTNYLSNPNLSTAAKLQLSSPKEQLPNFVNVGDFNSDSKIDLIVANSNDENVTILLGDGKGAFEVANGFTVGILPQSIGIGDFNGDDKADLAVTNSYNNSVSLLLGNGVGGFSPHTTFDVGDDPESIGIGDFDQDGKLDLVTANWGSNNISVLLGDGKGLFGKDINFAVGKYPNSVRVSDVNADNKLDLIISNDGSSNNVSVLLNTTVPNSISTGDITFSGNPQQNQTFSAINNLADADGLGAISYQWLSNGVAIEGATQSNYTPTQIDVGKTLSVTANYNDGRGNLETVTSSVDVAVANFNDLPTGEITILGTPTQGQSLTASNSLADLDGLGSIVTNG